MDDAQFNKFAEEVTKRWETMTVGLKDKQEHKALLEQKLGKINGDKKLCESKLKKMGAYTVPQITEINLTEWKTKMNELIDVYPLYEKIDGLNSEIKNQRNILELHIKEIEESEISTSKVPYNTECWACRQQPHKLHLDEQIQHKTNIENKIEKLMDARSELIKTNNLSNEKMEDLTAWLNEYKQMKQEQIYYDKQDVIIKKYKEVEPILKLLENLNL